MGFIQINNRILDEEEYLRQALLLKKLILFEISSAVLKYGFEYEAERFSNKDQLIEFTVKFLAPSSTNEENIYK